jgi:hypothetical protein
MNSDGCVSSTSNESNPAFDGLIDGPQRPRSLAHTNTSINISRVSPSRTRPRGMPRAARITRQCVHALARTYLNARMLQVGREDSLGAPGRDKDSGEEARRA